MIDKLRRFFYMTKEVFNNFLTTFSECCKRLKFISKSFPKFVPGPGDEVPFLQGQVNFNRKL